MEGFCNLASGSKGNCLYFGTKKTKILIDAGISGKSVKEKLGRIGVDLSEIQAILITHEHTDHIAGLSTLAFKYGIPVFANSETAKGIYHALGECPRFKIFTTNELFRFSDIDILPFSIQHDTPDPVAFTLQVDGLKIGVCTDLGIATSLVKLHLKECDYLVIEANHQPEMVHACARPQVYKKRVLGPSGHLSNGDCADLLEGIIHPKLRHIILAHLSKECNSPQTALEVVKAKIGQEFQLSIAPQELPGPAIQFT